MISVMNMIKTSKITVQILSRSYSMSEKSLKKVLEIASEQVPFGIYAVKKGNYCEIRNDKVVSKTQLKQLIRDYKQQGYKAYYNGL